MELMVDRSEYFYHLLFSQMPVGVSHLPEQSDYAAKRRNNFNYYLNRLGELDGICFLKEPNQEFFSNRWLTTITVNPKMTGGIDRENLRLKLEADNIEARPLWKPLHCQPVYQGCRYFGDGLSEKLFEQGLCLPSGSSLTDSDLDRICSVIERSLKV